MKWSHFPSLRACYTVVSKILFFGFFRNRPDHGYPFCGNRVNPLGPCRRSAILISNTNIKHLVRAGEEQVNRPLDSPPPKKMAHVHTKFWAKGQSWWKCSRNGPLCCDMRRNLNLIPCPPLSPRHGSLITNRDSAR